MIKNILPFLILNLGLYIVSFGQLDREFWFAVPEITSTHADRPIKLNISSGNYYSYIKISIPSDSNIVAKEIFLDANSNISFDITDWVDLLENNIYNSPQNRGLLITSDYPITVYYEVLGTKNQRVLNTEIFSLKGSNALGKEFYTPFQNAYNNFNFINAWSSIDIIATEDSTIVNFELTNFAYNNPNKTFSVVINKGQTYSVRCNSISAFSRFSGSKITSNKPIAVTLKDDSINKSGEQSYDLVGDQLIPIDLIGVEYILFKGENFILATEDSTEIYISGIYTTTINESQTYYFESFSPVLVETSKPTYVFQLTNTGYEYGGALIPHISCTGSYNININRSTVERFVLVLLVKNGGQSNFTLNNQSGEIKNTDFSFVPATNNEWLVFEKEFSLNEIAVGQQIRIENTSKPFHLGIISGSNVTGNRYGYFSSFNSLDLGVNFEACDNSILAVSSGLDSYTWNTGDTSNIIDIDSSGTYWIKGTEGTCEATDTIEVLIKPGITFELYNDTFLCGEPLILNSPVDTNLNYEWNTKETTPSISVNSKGNYSLRITNEYGCFAIDNVFIDEFIFTDLSIKDTLICKDEITITTTDFTSQFIWYNDNDTLSYNNYFSINEPGMYYMRRENNCGFQYDSFYVEKRDVFIPNVFTPNNDGFNDTFSIDLGIGKWSFSLYNIWGGNLYDEDDFKGTLPKVDLSDNVYYYSLIDKSCNDKNYKGWFNILK